MARPSASALPMNTLEACPLQALRRASMSCLTYQPPGHCLWFLTIKRRQRANRVPRSLLEMPRTRKTDGARSEGRGVEQGDDVVALVSLQHRRLGVQRVVHIERNVETLPPELRTHVDNIRRRIRRQAGCVAARCRIARVKRSRIATVEDVLRPHESDRAAIDEETPLDRCRQIPGRDDEGWCAERIASMHDDLPAVRNGLGVMRIRVGNRETCRKSSP